jgi:hypothetical protein
MNKELGASVDIPESLTAAVNNQPQQSAFGYNVMGLQG